MSSEPTADAESKVKRAAERRARKADSTKGSNDGWTATGTLMSGIIIWGGIGWLLSRWTDWVGFLPIGVILGAALGVYLVVKQAADPPPLIDISKNQRHRNKNNSTDTAQKRGSNDG